MGSEELQKILDQDRKELRILLARSMQERSNLQHEEIVRLLNLTDDEILAAFSRQLP